MERIQKALKKGEAALVFTEVNRLYLAGFLSSLGYLFITPESATLIVDGRYITAAKEKVKGCDLLLLGKASEQLKELAEKHKTERIYLENTISVADLKEFSDIFCGKEIVCDDTLINLIGKLRGVKSKQEVEKIVAAQRIAEKAFTEVLNFIKPGVSERAVAAELEYRMKLLGSEMPSFDTIAVSGYKSAMPHGVPDGKLIEAGDFMTLDFGAMVDGYHSDMTRTVAVGFATDEMQTVYKAVLDANLECERVLKPGLTGKAVDAATRAVIEKAGYGDLFTHSTGHSVGLEIHEGPYVSRTYDKPLEVGNVVTDEPGIYIEGKFGVRIEDMLLITPAGCENLTKAEKSLIIL